MQKIVVVPSAKIVLGLQIGFLSRYTVVVEWDGFKVGDKVKRRRKGNDYLAVAGLGLRDEFNEYVAITEIEPDGAVSAHNAANPAAPVKLRDVLRSVNGSGPTLAEINAAVEAAGRSS